MAGSTKLWATARDVTLSVLLISDEWSPTRGGISQFNRRLAIAFAAAGHRTACLVSTATPIEFEDARDHGVTLYPAVMTPAGPSLLVPVPEVVARKPDVIIGHDIVSGAFAWTYAERYVPNARFAYVMHTAPSQNEPYKGGGEAARRTAERENEIRRTAADADIVAAVGPLLARRAEAVVGDGIGGVSVLPLDPGLDLPADHTGHPRQPPSNPIVLMVCRTTHTEPKGLDIAANALVRVRVPHGKPKPELRIRGAYDAQCDSLRTELLEQSALARDRIDVRAYSANPADITHDMRQAALVVMPSRAEGFGLAALEAIGMGTPVLVSDRSGLAETLRHHLGWNAEPMIVPVTDDIDTDAPVWSEAIQRALDDLPTTYKYAHQIREELAPKLRWSTTVDEIVSRLPIPAPRSGGLS
jgi:glycosyltransferase involved in cell wall biosynthesis